MSVSDDLNAAADYLDEHDWIQGCFGNEDIGVCVLGAINRVVPFRMDRDLDAYSALSNYLGISNIGEWNDQPGRTKDEVIQALRDAATKNQPDSMWG